MKYLPILLFLLLIVACNERSKPDERDKQKENSDLVKIDTGRYNISKMRWYKHSVEEYEITLSSKKSPKAAFKQHGKWTINDAEEALEILWQSYRQADSLRNNRPFVIIQTSPKDTFRYVYPDTIYVGPDKNLQQL